MEQQQFPLVLLIQSGGKERQVVFDGGFVQTASFGQLPENAIVIENETVSRSHGAFLFSEGCWYVQDRGSRNGVYVNGVRGSGEPVPVMPGDRILLGSDPGKCAVIDILPPGRQPFPSFRMEPPPAWKGRPARDTGGGIALLVLDGLDRVSTFSIDLSLERDYGFGRDSSNAIVLRSGLAGRMHGAFCVRGGQCYVSDLGSRNGTLLNGSYCRGSGFGPGQEVCAGDILRIDSPNPDAPEAEGVLIAVAEGGAGDWKRRVLDPGSVLTIGRETGNDIQLSHVGVSRYHAKIFYADGGWCIEDTSTNGTFVNGVSILGRTRLADRSMITITTSRMFFVGGVLLYTVAAKGLSIEARELTRDVKDGGRAKRILEDVNLRVKPGEFVAIVGGSGCGKSTLLNAMTGYDRATGGSVLVNDVSLYENYDYFKTILGYVPQQDIVHDMLTLRRMLSYTAKLRMPEDTSVEDREKRVNEVLEIVELSEFADSMIKKLSGGQKKRASIAVELLADPGLFFLDEPTSGLDPGTERNMMQMLRSLATQKHKTVIMVTHTTLNLHLCDKIIFMGKGGRLCYCGGPEEAKRFFGVDNFVDTYNLIAENTEHWADKFARERGRDSRPDTEEGKPNVHGRPSFFRQLSVLSGRYLNLMCNDRARLLILLLEPVILAVVLKICASKEVYEAYLDTKNMLFTFTCCGIWIGIFNAIQEICKERVILKREYMANLRLTAYVGSKLLVQALLCAVQACLLLFTFLLLAGSPEKHANVLAGIGPVTEMLITTYLTIFSSACMGLMVSAFAKNADRAMSLAPFLLVIQLVFAGIIFKLEGAVKTVSYGTISRWAISALGTSVDLDGMYGVVRDKNEMIEKLTGEAAVVDRSLDLFPHTEENLLTAWLVLLGFSVLFCLLATLILRKVSKDSR